MEYNCRYLLPLYFYLNGNMKKPDYKNLSSPMDEGSAIAFFNESSQLRRFLDGVSSRFPQSKIDLVLSFQPQSEVLSDYPRVEQVHIYYRNLSRNPLSRLMGRFKFLNGLRQQNHTVVVVPQRGLKFYSLAMLMGGEERYIYLYDDERWLRCTLPGWGSLFLRRLAETTVKGPFSYLFMLVVVIGWGIVRSFKHLWRGIPRGTHG